MITSATWVHVQGTCVYNDLNPDILLFGHKALLPYTRGAVTPLSDTRQTGPCG